MSDHSQREMRSIVDELRRQLVEITDRLAQLESTAPPAAPDGSGGGVPATASSGPTTATSAAPSSDHGTSQAAAEEGPSDETLLAIAAAVAAFLGERVRVRQIRLISSSAWAQQGRVSIQGSHHLDR